MCEQLPRLRMPTLAFASSLPVNRPRRQVSRTAAERLFRVLEKNGNASERERGQTDRQRFRAVEKRDKDPRFVILSGTGGSRMCEHLPRRRVETSDIVSADLFNTSSRVWRENEDRWCFLGVVLGPSTPSYGFKCNIFGPALSRIPSRCTRSLHPSKTSPPSEKLYCDEPFRRIRTDAKMLTQDPKWAKRCAVDSGCNLMAHYSRTMVKNKARRPLLPSSHPLLL